MGRGSNTNEFIEKAIKIHGGKYNYSQVSYICQSAEVLIICEIHGDFFQLPQNHLQGHGCKECGNSRNIESKLKGKDFFIQKCKVIHSNKYDYSMLPKQVQGTTSVDIKCPYHGTFTQKLASHSLGVGCPSCGYETVSKKGRMELEEFLAISNKVHINKYEYIVKSFKTCHPKVEIICLEHGVFLQYKAYRTQGSGCPKCANEKNSIANRLNQIGPANLYYIKLSKQGKTFFKIGVTSKTIEERFYPKALNGCTLEVISMKSFDTAGDAYLEEQTILKTFRSYLIDFRLIESGNTEIFTEDVLKLDI